MIRDITLGQYYPTDSWVHKLDPRVKIIATLLFIVELFIVDNFIGFLVAAILIGVIVGISHVPFGYITRGLKPILIILLFTFALNIFMVQGEVIWQWKFLHITREGLYVAAFMGIRLILLIIGSSLLTLCTRPLSLTDGIERLLSPFKKIGLPAHEIAMMMSIALRFIPILMEETDKIIKAQTARGASFEDKNMIKRVKSLVPVLVPLFVSAFRRASDLAMAMEARCYRGGDGRTKMKPLKYHRVDFVGYVVIIIYFACIIFTGIYAHYLPFGEGL